MPGAASYESNTLPVKTTFDPGSPITRRTRSGSSASGEPVNRVPHQVRIICQDPAGGNRR
jgi:hypothetical protein